MLQAHGQDNKNWTDLRFGVFAVDADNHLIANASFPDAPAYSRLGRDWVHVALVYDYETGNGQWTLYVDGQNCGTIENTAKPESHAGSNFYIGGRPNDLNCLRARVDCVRASKGVLTPAQLMTGTEAAPDVLALWPLDTPDGYNYDLRDVVGTWSFDTKGDYAYTPAGASASHATVANPESTERFSGHSATNTGSAVFNSSALGYAKPRSFLSTMDPATCAALRLGEWTFEMYVCRTAEVNEWEILFGLVRPYKSEQADSAYLMELNVTYRTDGLKVYVKNDSKLNDASFPGSAGVLAELNRWYHVAVTAHDNTLTLYVDGELIGTLDRSFKTLGESALVIGGRWWNDHAFKGAMDEVRLSDRALEPSEFLCARRAASAPVPVKTLASWKLDSAAGAAGLENTLGPAYGLTAGADGARWTGDLGAKLDVKQPFTVEDWIKWGGLDGAGTPVTLCGTWQYNNSGVPVFAAGWGLEFRRVNGATVLGVTGVAPYQSPYVDGEFDYDFTRHLDTWTHVAVTYAPFEGRGTWRLYVDGKDRGTVENLFAPKWSTATHRFTIGAHASVLGSDWAAASYTGGLDNWRVSQGVLTKDELLCGGRRGTLILFR